MKRHSILFYISIAVLIAAGMLFIKSNRYEKTVRIIEDLKDKTVVFYSSNFKRLYLNSPQSQVGDMEKLCFEGYNIINDGGMSSFLLRIEDGNADPYTLSSSKLDKVLKKDDQYILLDLSRGQTRHGEKYIAGDKNCSPIDIIISKKSLSFDQSLLFIGRVKAVIEKKYPTLPVRITTVDTEDYNQSLGYIGILIELGDSANSYDEAKESMKILCEAIKEVI
ncbi:stage II sporulation protein P (SpoIIP) [Oxobacter pfennigii]|uniref:Stage II sporulation protein P (SpoIIP) n=1 Tax=Oxobacter pfennigii TaxID=36849 RepID=A0A0P8W5B8_9CLOT|nr:stage II sporulation protein P [Oxobacter pfennigii]KPU43102.1 stage II sporulation protein P (SpoIIP) [Oxobacter pfennigii]